MKQTIFKYVINAKPFEHKLDFIYNPPEGGFVRIDETLFTCETMVDEFTKNESVQIRRILLKVHNIS